MSCARLGLSLSAALLLWAASGAAQDRSSAEIAQAKRYFRAGASAYELGDYLAAIQALESAYRVTPLPAIAFSLAQAERRQYFVSRERSHLDRAIALYRVYLSQVPSGGRRADATDALGQLEPLALLGVPPTAAASDGPAVVRTRLMITTAAPNAKVRLDGGAPAQAPLIAQVTPGMHRVRVEAPGYFAGEREVDAIAGELIPVEVELRERPALAWVKSSAEADLHVDGAYAGRVEGERRLELPSGTHVFSFARNGHALERTRAEFAPGSSRKLSVTLEPTGQRTAAIALFVASGAALASGAVLTGFAIAREHTAVDISERRAQHAISPEERADYGEALRARDRLRIGAGVSFAAALVGGVTGLILYAFDQPDLREEAPGAQLRVVALDHGRSLGVDGRLHF